MKMLWAVMWIEIRLVWRRRSFWVLQGLVLLSAFRPKHIVVGSVTDEMGALLTMELLLLPILVGPAIARDLGGVGEMLWATSLDALSHVVGVIGGLWLMLLSALVVQIAVRSLIGHLVYGLQVKLFWAYGLPLLCISVSTALGLVALLALFLRYTLPILLVWGALAISMLVWAKMTSPLNLGFSRLTISSDLGLGPHRPFVQGLSVWFIGMGLMTVPLLVSIALFVDRRRAVRRSVPLLLWALVAALIMGSGYLWHAQAVAAQRSSILSVEIVRAHNLRVRLGTALSVGRGLCASIPKRNAVDRLKPRWGTS